MEGQFKGVPSVWQSMKFHRGLLAFRIGFGTESLWVHGYSIPVEAVNNTITRKPDQPIEQPAAKVHWLLLRRNQHTLGGIDCTGWLAMKKAT